MSELFLSLLIYPALITSLRVSWYVNTIPLLVITVYHNCWLEKYFCESAINCNDGAPLSTWIRLLRSTTHYPHFHLKYPVACHAVHLFTASFAETTTVTSAGEK